MDSRDTHKGHRQRMRERAASEGFDAFNPHQVMEVLLFYAIPRQDVSELAHTLIDRFGSVRGVLQASREELTKVDGVGARVADWLMRVGELIDAYGDLRAEDRVQIGNFRDAFAFCEKRMESIAPPATYHICLTPSGTVQLFSKLCDSLSWGEPEVLQRSLDEILSVNARNVILVEFTQDALPQIGEYDRAHARDFAYLLRVMGAELLDVIIVGSEDILSMNRSGDYDRTILGPAQSVLSSRYLREDREEPADALPVSDDGL